MLLHHCLDFMADSHPLRVYKLSPILSPRLWFLLDHRPTAFLPIMSTLMSVLAMRSHMSKPPNPTGLIQSLNAVESLRVLNFFPLGLVLSLASLTPCVPGSHVPQFLPLTSWMGCARFITHSYLTLCWTSFSVMMAAKPPALTGPLLLFPTASLSIPPEDGF